MAATVNNTTANRTVADVYMNDARRPGSRSGFAGRVQQVLTAGS